MSPNLNKYEVIQRFQDIPRHSRHRLLGTILLLQTRGQPGSSRVCTDIGVKMCASREACKPMLRHPRVLCFQEKETNNSKNSPTKNKADKFLSNDNEVFEHLKRFNFASMVSIVASGFKKGLLKKKTQRLSEVNLKRRFLRLWERSCSIHVGRTPRTAGAWRTEASSAELTSLSSWLSSRKNQYHNPDTS